MPNSKWDFTKMEEADLQAAFYMQELFNVLYLNQGLQPLIDKARDIFNRPLLVHDTSFKILASSYDINQVVSISEDETGSRYLHEDLIRFIRENNIIRRIRKKGASDYIEKQKPLNGTLSAIIRINSIEAAQIAIHESGRPFTKTDFLLIDQFSKLLSLELQKDNQFGSEKDLIPSYILSDALEGRAIDEKAALRKLHYLKWVQEQEFSIMFITNRELKALDSKIPIVMQALKIFVPLNHCMIHHSNIVAFLDGSLLSQLSGKKKAEFEEFLAANNLCAGISLKFNQLLDCRKYYEQAVKATELAHQQNTSALLFEECGLFIVSELIRTHYELVDLCHPAVLTLFDYDKKNGSDLLVSLKNYLYFTNDPGKAAKILNIHKNTLFYRINKIKDIAGISLDNAEEICRIYLSIRFLEINGRL
ncbi:PucR family transcriptional regulator [Propionispora hippei]|uniref:PucR C-terminal helix-turn-helix domain-containing protein n=1 Tax=Propionispora hippei DSM 15287 TaxID=1123003 RepID=A0A1M6DRP9_9FIRM|nr:PucR family transcriptional regulator [Propionispora hippei]SHI75914.1 PucR C-terminal helix-turn-helix domain-containing protein [Propionispora hippei DSM 15287]